MLPLAGIRVLDLSRLLPGPFCSMLLADYGAEVIKIEDPSGGDYIRTIPPLEDGVGLYFRALNRNKKSLTLNLKEAAGVEVFRRLVQKVDVVLESFRPGVATKLGIDFPTLKAINGRLVYASLSGYGQTGPYRDRSGHDLDYLAIAGALATFSSGPGAAPVLPGIQVADMAGAMSAAFAILTALLGRERSGQGAFLDLSMTDAVLSWLPFQAARTFQTGRAPGAGETELTGAIARYGCYATSDGRYVALGALEDKFWQAFCQAADRPEWLSERSQHRLRDELSDFFGARPLAAWTEWASRHDVCLEPVLSLEETFDHPQIRARGVIDREHRQVSPLFPWPEAGYRGEAPSLGLHTDEVLADAGLGSTEIRSLRDRGIV